MAARESCAQAYMCVGVCVGLSDELPTGPLPVATAAMHSGYPAARQTHLLSPTAPQVTESVSQATEAPLTIVISPLSSVVDLSPLACLEDAHEDSRECESQNLQKTSSRPSGTNGLRSSAVIYPVTAYLSTATDKSFASSEETTVWTSLANDTRTTDNLPSPLRQPQHRPGLITFRSLSGDVVHKRPATLACKDTFTKWNSTQPTAAAVAAAPLTGAAVAQQQQAQASASPVEGPTSPTPFAVATGTREKQPDWKSGDATSVRASRPRASAPTTRSGVAAPAVPSKRCATRTDTTTATRYGTPSLGARQDSHAKQGNPKGRLPRSDLDNSKEGVDWSYAAADHPNLLWHSMGLAKVRAPQRLQQQQHDTVASASVANVAQSPPQRSRHDESTRGKAGQDIGACNNNNNSSTSKHVEEANHRQVAMGTLLRQVDRASDLHGGGGGGVADDNNVSLCDHTTVAWLLEQEGNNTGGDSANSALPPPEGRSPAPEGGNAAGPAAMAEDDDVADADMKVFVAVRVRPRISLLPVNAAPPASLLTEVAALRSLSAPSATSPNVEHEPQRGRSGGSQVEERRLTSDSTTSHSTTMRGRRSEGERAAVKAAKATAGNGDGDDNASKGSCLSADAVNGFIDCVAVAAAGEQMRTLRFHFDHILDDSAGQADIMTCIGQRAVTRVLQGYHSTVMCYGQSGSGKTYTIAGPHGGKLSRKTLQWLASHSASAEAVERDYRNVDEDDQVLAAASVGLIPRILHQLFHELEARHGAGGGQQRVPTASMSSWRVALSALELYNEDLRDLLPGELTEQTRAQPGKKDTFHPLAAPHCHHGRETSTATPSPLDSGEPGPSPSLPRMTRHRSFHELPGEPTSEDGPDVLSTVSSCEDDTDNKPTASRPTSNGPGSGSATTSAVKRGRGQPSASPSPCAALMRARVSKRIGSGRNNSAMNQNRTAAASMASTTSSSGAGTATGLAKTTSTKWTASATTQAAAPLKIRQGALAPSTSPSPPLAKSMKARAALSPPSSRSLSREPTRGAGCDAACVEGLHEHQVHDLHEAMEVVWLALRRRQMGSTELNKDSSRSHAFFFVRVEQRKRRSRDEAQPVWDIRRSTLSLVDLAGSERVSHTGAHGLQLKEAQNINRSLSALGNVMRLLSSVGRASPSNKIVVTTPVSGAAALTKVATAEPHIPYRDSKLTRILQSSLGGGALTLLLCNVSPDPRDAPATMSTLQFAKLCKNVKSNAKLNKTTRDTAGAQAASESRIRQLLGDVSTAQNRLRQLATYAWWLEGHLAYFAAAMTQQQRRLRTLTTSTDMGTITSPSHSCGSGGSRDIVVPEEATAPKGICNTSSPSAGDGNRRDYSSIESLGDRERGFENKGRADSGAAPGSCRHSAALAGPTSQEWWYLSPRPLSASAPAENDKDAGEEMAEVEAYWQSGSARALLSPAYPITQRHLVLQRKLIAAAAVATPHVPTAMLPMSYSTDALVGEARATTRNCVANDTRLLEVAPVVRHAQPTRNPRRQQLGSSPSTATLSSVPPRSIATRQRQQRCEPPMKDIVTALSEERAARAAAQARLAVVEQSNVLLRLRLAEAHQATSAEKTRRGEETAGKDASGVPSEVMSVAPASSVLWPTHHSRVSQYASLEVFLARCGFAAMDPMEPSVDEMSPRRLA
ncbi:Kinesin motor domain containing protein [Leishmania braziliensis]|nr:Kinesin motor domain containing protein [Leishmania braziliensis]